MLLYILPIQLSLQQGANGLLLRVQPHLHLGDAGVFDLTQAGDDSQPWSDTLENLSAGEQVLSKMMEVLAGTTDGTVSPTNKWMAAALDEEEEDEMSVESRSVGTIGEAPSYAFNVRIKVMIHIIFCGLVNCEEYKHFILFSLLFSIISINLPFSQRRH